MNLSTLTQGALIKNELYNKYKISVSAEVSNTIVDLYMELFSEENVACGGIKGYKDRKGVDSISRTSP